MTTPITLFYPRAVRFAVAGPYCPLMIKPLDQPISFNVLNNRVLDVLARLSVFQIGEAFPPDNVSLDDVLRIKRGDSNATIVTDLLYERKKYLCGMTYDDAVQYLASEMSYTITEFKQASQFFTL